MAELDDKVIVTKSKITDIADALREEMSESNEYSLPTMVEKVHELGQGQGSEYTAGVGIDITNRVVSVVDTLMIRGESSGSVASIVDGADDIPLKSCVVAIEPVQSGSGDPSPSNVRPITGWTECNITVADDETTPTISNVYNIEFPSEAGTVYGGTLDVTNGVLTVTRAMRDMGTLNWVNGGTNVFAAVLSGVKVYTSGLSPYLCSNYKTINISNQIPSDDKVVWQYYNTQTVRIKDTNYNDKDVFKEAMNGVQLVYELATPTTYNLNPTEIKTLLGINNIFADTGDIENVEYTRDATSIINYILSKIENI